MNDADVTTLSRARAARLYTERDGVLLAEFELAGFEINGDDAFSEVATGVRDDIAQARWGELIDAAGAVVATGALVTREPEADGTPAQ